VILCAHSSTVRGLLPRLSRGLRIRIPRRSGPQGPDGTPTTERALVQALCHDMHGSLACLESALRRVAEDSPGDDDLLALAREQAAHLTSMLRTAEASGGAPSRRPATGRLLADVVAASAAATGLPRAQLTVGISEAARRIVVGDARLQRILINLLENAHRHGGGALVRLEATCAGGWLELVLRQSGVRATRVAPYLQTTAPPADLTGLGLWSVQRQARELGGRVVCEDDGCALTLRVQLPDR
jgi:signal transduction histidine kinase